jgi:hypothetical protein
MLLAGASMKPHRGKGRGIDVKGHSKYEEQFVPIPYSMAKSEAWRSLSGSAVKVYVELRRRFLGFNNGCIAMGYGEAAKRLGLGKTTVSRALAELANKGFIVMVKPGQYLGRRATEWAVTDRSLHGHPPTNAWRRWVPNSGVSTLPKKDASKNQ